MTIECATGQFEVAVQRLGWVPSKHKVSSSRLAFVVGDLVNRPHWPVTWDTRDASI
jgi:hypothetical protein